MTFDIPLFAFGVFITLLVAIGVFLALAEFRQAHGTQPSAGKDSGGVKTRNT